MDNEVRSSVYMNKLILALELTAEHRTGIEQRISSRQRVKGASYLQANVPSRESRESVLAKYSKCELMALKLCPGAQADNILTS